MSKPDYNKILEESKQVIGLYRSHFLTETSYKSSKKLTAKRLEKVFTDLNKNLDILVSEECDESEVENLRNLLSEFQMKVGALRDKLILGH